MSKDQPLVSVIMSAFNSDKTIEKSIESILNQTYKNIEFLIMDDGSKDRSNEILNEYNDKYSNIKIYKNKINIGLTKSLNILLYQTKGDLIARQDADDESLPNRIEQQVSKLLEKSLDFCTTRALRMDSEKKIPGLSYYLPKKLLIKFKNPFIHGTLLIKKTAIASIDFYDEQFIYAQDYKLFTDLMSQGYKFKNINKALYKLNTIDNISVNKKDEQKYYAMCVKKKLKPKSTFIK